MGIASFDRCGSIAHHREVHIERSDKSKPRGRYPVKSMFRHYPIWKGIVARYNDQTCLMRWREFLSIVGKTADIRVMLMLNKKGAIQQLPSDVVERILCSTVRGEPPPEESLLPTKPRSKMRASGHATQFDVCWMLLRRKD